MTTTVFTTILVALITAVLGPIIVAWVKLKMEKKSQNTLMFDARMFYTAISREQAQIGYSTIAEELPTASKLGQIYSQEGITYGQTEAEQATFKGLASAKRKKEQLAERERAAFQGSSGVAEPGLSTTYMRKSSSAGYF